MRTVNIVICDDDEALREILRSKIGKICEEAGTACQISCCGSGEEVLERLEKGQEPSAAPDILFLDIQMPGRNGMEIAEQLRRRHCGTILIFVTALSEYVYEAFDVGALHYLVKPFGDDKLREVLGRALRQYAGQQELAAMRQAEQGGQADRMRQPEQCNQADQPQAILVKRGGISTKVLLADIIYAEVFNRKVMLHTLNGDIEYYGKLTDLSEQVGADFYRTHRAYLVNLKYVEKYNATTIWLERGTALVSKKQFAGFVRQYMQYISRKKK